MTWHNAQGLPTPLTIGVNEILGIPMVRQVPASPLTRFAQQAMLDWIEFDDDEDILEYGHVEPRLLFPNPQ